MTDRNWKLGVKIMILSVLGIFLTVTIVVFIASGIFLKPQYLEPWHKSYSDKFDDPRIKLAAHGLLAANGHNMQPWRVKLDSNKNVFYLFADSERLVKEVDPYARQTLVSQGTFLEYVRVAGEELGYKVDITFFPNGQYDEKKLLESMKTKPVAKVTITKTEPKSSPVYQYMFLQDTNRGAYQKQELTSEEIKQILAINTDSEIAIELFQDQRNRKKLGNYAVEGAKIESSIHRMNQESAEVFRANEYVKNKYRYGFSVEGQGTKGIMKYIMQGIITLFPSINSEKNSAELYVKSTITAVENTPAYALLITKDNSRIEQVKAGMFYSRLILTAHSLGLVMQPPSQVLEEYPEMREQYSKIHKDYASNGRTIQMFFRIGKPTQEFPQSMRQDVMNFID